MTRSGLSLEELRIVEGQGQSTEVSTPPEEINRMNELGKSSRPPQEIFEVQEKLGDGSNEAAPNKRAPLRSRS